jgi:hypothetical protein
MQKPIANNDAARQDAGVGKNRKEIYLGARLRELLARRRDTLTTVVNVMADRYLGILDRTGHHDELGAEGRAVLRAVLAEQRGPMSAAQIATLPALLKDFEARTGNQVAGRVALKLSGVPFAELVAMVESIEAE